MKKATPLTRILFSVALLAVVIYLYQQRKSGGRDAASRQPLPAISPADAGTDRFAWIPAYSGADISGIHSRITHGELNYGFEFQTAEDMHRVIDYYETRLHQAGFTVETKLKGNVEIDLHAESPDRKRTIDVVAEQPAEKSPSVVAVAAVQK